MRTRSRSFWIGATAIALTWVLGHTNTGHAQLFPNLPIQRPKVPCDQESPFYGMVRQNYYGYFPTCWRKFPPGWTCPCPNPEKPDYEASKAKIPLQNDPNDFDTRQNPAFDMDDEGLGPLPGNGGNRPAGPGRNGGPPLPDRGSPFDLDQPANPAGGARPGGRFDMPPGGAATRRSVKPIASLPNIGDLTPTPTNASPTVGEFPDGPAPDVPPAIPDPAVGPTSASRILTPSARKPGLLGGVRALFGTDRR